MRASVESSTVRRWGEALTPALQVSAACGLGLWTQWPSLEEDPTNSILFVAVGVAFVLTGVLSRLEPAQRANGALFVAIGIVWLANDVNSRLTGRLHVIGWLVRPLAELLLIVILMRYPAARIGDRLTRWAVVAAFVVVLAPYLISGFLWDPYVDGWTRTFWWPTVAGINPVAHSLWIVYAVAGLTVLAWLRGGPL